MSSHVPSSPTLDSDLALAHQLADIAAPVSQAFFKRSPRQWRKADGSLATEADVAVEDAIRAHLATERPGDAILGEEGGPTGESARRWILDPIDGTNDFVKGSGNWITLIGLEVSGRMAVAVCDQPHRHRRYWAVRGGGAFMKDSSTPCRLRVSEISSLGEAQGYVPSPKWLSDADHSAMATHLAAATTTRVAENHHPALEVACGSRDLAVWFVSGPWDIAAPALIVEEAGGRFSNARGQYDFASGSAVFSNGRLHDQILSALAGR